MFVAVFVAVQEHLCYSRTMLGPGEPLELDCSLCRPACLARARWGLRLGRAEQRAVRLLVRQRPTINVIV